MKLAQKTAKQADTARRRSEVQEKFAAMTEEERDQWRLARQAKRQNRKSETEQKRSRLQQVLQGQHCSCHCVRVAMVCKVVPRLRMPATTSLGLCLL